MDQEGSADIPGSWHSQAGDHHSFVTTVLVSGQPQNPGHNEPTYVDFMELPGGCVELDESPRQAAAREVKEELGLDREPGRLLAMDWVPPRPVRNEGLIAVFDGGRLTAEEIGEIRLPADELRAFAFLPTDEAVQALPELLARRLESCLHARGAATTAYLENGSPVG